MHLEETSLQEFMCMIRKKYSLSPRHCVWGCLLKVYSKPSVYFQVLMPYSLPTEDK